MTSNYSTSDTVLAFGRSDTIKNAVLFFDRVIPLTFSPVPKSFLPDDITSTVQRYFANYLLVRDLILMTMYRMGYTNLVNEADEQKAAAENLVGMSWHCDLLYTKYSPVPGMENEVNDLLVEFVERNPKIREPGFFPDKNNYPGFTLKKRIPFRDYIFNQEFCFKKYPVFGLDYLAAPQSSALDAILIGISKVPVVDVSRASWEQIEEFKCDEKSRLDFKRLKLFLHDHYLSKDIEYVRDDLELRIDQFHKASAKHGFETTTGHLKAIVKSKFVLGGGLGGLMALTFGHGEMAAILASSALFAGGIAEIADRLLSIRSAQYDLKYRSEENELAYILKAQAKLAT
jgi:hypothetical protein